MGRIIMKLFHQLEEQDQQNSVHFCLHVVIEDLMTDGVELEAASPEDEEARDNLVKIIEETHKLPKEEQFSFIMNSSASELVFNIALDMARSSYYHSDEDFVINYEKLRDEYKTTSSSNSSSDDDDEEESDSMILDESVNTLPKKGKHSLN